ncbi:HEPN domain-containing protein [Bacillus velezensis]
MKNIVNKDIFDVFTVQGYWWIDKDKENQVPGTLIYKPEEITLEIMGALVNDFIDIGDTPKVINGISVDGELYKLDVLAAGNSNFRSPGIPTSVYEIRSFLVGDYTKVFPEKFDSAEFSTGNLTEWMGLNAFTQVFDSKGKKHEIHYDRININRVTVKDFIVQETSEVKIKNQKSGQCISMEHVSGFKIIPSERKDLNWFNENVNHQVRLVNLLMNNINYDINITLNVKENKRQLKYKYFQHHREVLRQKNANFLFDYNKVRTNYETLLNNWFQEREKLSTIVSLFMNSKDQKEFVETKFIKNIQCLEIFHRRYCSSSEFNQELIFETEKVREFIDSNVSDDNKSFFLNKLKHINEVNLMKRLKELFNQQSTDTKNFLSGNSKNRDSFIFGLVETRNYLTHYDLTNKTKVFHQAVEKYYASLRMNGLLTFLILKKIGLDEEIILNSMKENRNLNQNFSHAKKILDK